MSKKKKFEAELIKEDKQNLPLSRTNFYIMGAAALMIIIGFLLMLGDGTTTESFNPDIFSTRRIVVAPTLAFIGFVVMAFGIIYRTRKNKK